MAEAGRRPRLLLVDDDELIVESLSFALEGDFDVVSALSRAGAQARLRELAEPPALALVDLGL
ncbi:MAG: sigma-54-dependent Fis family transcriptional regulator, partial [Gammaproteobacteria bacterium]